MSYHQVTIHYPQGESVVYDGVVDVNHYESALVILMWEDGHSKVIKNFRSIDVSAPMDKDGNPIQALHEVDSRPDMSPL